MNTKAFSERLNVALDEIDFPPRMDERVEAFSKLIKVPRFKAEALLDGTLFPEPELLATITQELEVSESWLKGESA